MGPIGVLRIRRTLAEGRLAGLVTGLGAATADTFYGAVAAFGLTASAFRLSDRYMLRLIGGGVSGSSGGAHLCGSASGAGGRGGRQSSCTWPATTLVHVSVDNHQPADDFPSRRSSPGWGWVAEHDDWRQRCCWWRGCLPGRRCGGYYLSGGVSLLRGPVPLKRAALGEPRCRA